VLGGLPRIITGLLMCKVPWSQGKMQGISPIQPLFAKIRLENFCESSSFETNSKQGAGNYLREQGINSGLWTGAGNCPQNRSACHDASDRVSSRLRK
jgi:hypothetical protein